MREIRTQKYAAALHLRDHVRYRIGLSGTPIKNYGGEVRVVMNVILPDALGTEKEFGREHCGGSYGEKARVKDPDALGALLVRRGLMTNRTRKQVGRYLPPVKTFVQPVEVDMTALDRVKVDTLAYARTLLRHGGDPLDKRNAAKEIDWRLRQATGLAKAPAVAEFVKILAGRSPVLLFGWHRGFWLHMARALVDFKPVFYTGEETPLQKKRAVDAFLAGDSQVFCMSLRAGEGVDGLQKVCSTCVFGELDWTWTQMMRQNVGRIAREGQDQNVFAHVMLADDGADPAMADALNIKREQFMGLIQPGEHVVEEVQTDPAHVKELARSWLKAHDPRGLAAIEREIAEAEAAKDAARASSAAGRRRSAPAPTPAAPELLPAPASSTACSAPSSTPAPDNEPRPRRTWEEARAARGSDGVLTLSTSRA